MENTSQRGMTIIEIVISVGIIAIISSALAVFVVDNYRFQSMTITEGQSYGEAQRAVDRMKKEIRHITIGENGAYPITNAESQALTIYSDYDYDGDIERIRYFVDGTSLYRGITEPQAAAEVYPDGQETTDLITENIANGAEAIFLYYDENYTGQEAPMNPPVKPSIKAIGIHLIVDNTPWNDTGRYVTDTLINLRNL